MFECLAFQSKAYNHPRNVCAVLRRMFSTMKGLQYYGRSSVTWKVFSSIKGVQNCEEGVSLVLFEAKRELYYVMSLLTPKYGIDKIRI